MTLDGKVIIQTYNPDNFSIEYAKKQDYDLFYNQELNLRKMLNYPPFCDIILIRFTGKNLGEIQKISETSRSMITIYDLPLTYIPESGLIHPECKEEVGQRMALCAQGLVYNNISTSNKSIINFFPIFNINFFDFWFFIFPVIIEIFSL